MGELACEDVEGGVRIVLTVVQLLVQGLFVTDMMDIVYCEVFWVP